MGGEESRSQLLERVGERRAIADALRAVAEGEGRVLWVEGPAGVGKTALLDLLAHKAGAGVTLARARGTEMEREFAYGVTLQLLAPLVEAEGDGLFTGAAALARPLFERAGVDIGSDIDSSFRLLHGLHWLCANLADRAPLVLCVDDVQWVDEDSARFLTYLGARAAEMPLLVAACRRAGEPAALSELSEPPIAVPLKPAELSAEAVTALTEDRLGREAARHLGPEIFRLSGGNPLFVEELIRGAGKGEALDSPPPTVVKLVQRRLEHLPEAAREVAHALAVLDDPAPVAALRLWLVWAVSAP